MTKETLEFFKQLLSQVSINASSPDFDKSYETISNAKKELEESLKMLEELSKE